MKTRTRFRGPRGSQHTSRSFVSALGYVSPPPNTAAAGVPAQQAQITQACEALGLRLVDVLAEKADASGPGERESLERALERLEAGEVSCLVVCGLEHLSSRVDELAGVIDRLERTGARLIALDVGLDTASSTGRLALERRPVTQAGQPVVPTEPTEEVAAAAGSRNGASAEAPAVAHDEAAPLEGVEEAPTEEQPRVEAVEEAAEEMPAASPAEEAVEPPAAAPTEATAPGEAAAEEAAAEEAAADEAAADEAAADEAAADEAAADQAAADQAAADEAAADEAAADEAAADEAAAEEAVAPAAREAPAIEPPSVEPAEQAAPAEPAAPSEEAAPAEQPSVEAPVPAEAVDERPVEAVDEPVHPAAVEWVPTGPKAGQPPEGEEVEPLPAAVAARTLGYATLPLQTGGERAELERQVSVIKGRCSELGLELVEVIRERQVEGRALDRPGLSLLIERIAAGDAGCVIVASLARLSHSVAELGTIVKWLERNKIRLIAVDLDLDTASPGGRLTARALASVANWEHERLSERTRKGLAAARAKRRAASEATGPSGQPSEWPEVSKRIARMRAEGMTLQAIADQLNAEGVPTPRGGAKWRPSSVQTAAGYKRRSRAKKADDLPRVAPWGGSPPRQNPR